MGTVGNTQFVSISSAKNRLSELVDAGKATVLVRQNEPVGAVVSIERYNEYLAMEKLIRNPALFDELREKARVARSSPLQELRSLEDFERTKRAESRSRPGLKMRKAR